MDQVPTGDGFCSVICVSFFSSARQGAGLGPCLLLSRWTLPPGADTSTLTVTATSTLTVRKSRFHPRQPRRFRPFALTP